MSEVSPDKSEALTAPEQQATPVLLMVLDRPGSDDTLRQLPNKPRFHSQLGWHARLGRLTRTAMAWRRSGATELQTELDEGAEARYRGDGALAALVLAQALVEYPVWGMGAEPKQRQRAAAMVSDATGVRSRDGSFLYRFFGEGYTAGVVHRPGLKEAWADLHPGRRTPEPFVAAFRSGFEATGAAQGFEPNLERARRLIKALPKSIYAVLLSEFGVSAADYAQPDNDGRTPRIDNMLLTEFGVTVPLLGTGEDWTIPNQGAWFRSGARRKNVLCPTDELLDCVRSGLAQYIDRRVARHRQISEGLVDYLKTL